jgi:hypothetical protein
VEARPERETKKALFSRAVFHKRAQKLREEAKKSARLRSRPSASEAFYPGEWISNHAPNVAFGFRDGASFRLPRFFLD